MSTEQTAGVGGSAVAPPKPDDTTSSAREEIDFDGPPEEDFDGQIDALVDLEQEMQQEQYMADQNDDADDGLEGGGFFPEGDAEGASAAAGSHAAAGASTAARSASSRSSDPDSLDEDPPLKPYAHGCRECGSIGIQKNFETAYGVRVCFRCQQVHRERYSLLTQTTATTQYMLPLVAIQTLGFIEKQNTQKKACWGTMKLYWKQQVLALARQRYGTKANLEQAKLERDLARIRKDDAKRRTAHQTAARSAAFASTLAASMADLADQTPAEVVAMLQQRTAGMAPSRDARDRANGRTKSKKRKASGTAEGEDDEEGGAEATETVAPSDDADADSDVEVIETKATAPSKKKRAKPPASMDTKRKTLHTHVFTALADGRQQCTDPACRFTMEFESF